MWAAAEGHAAVVPALVRYGADVGARSNRGFTALLFAAREGRTDVVQTLLEAGADLDEQISINSTLTAGGVERRRASDAGLNAFLLAAGSAHFELAAYLLDRGADPNAAPRGWTALHQLTWVRKAGIAGSNNPAPRGSGEMTSLDFARKLVAHGADLNARVTTRPPAGITALNFIGGTPFLLAARTADAEYMELLAGLGADVFLTNEDDSTRPHGRGRPRHLVARRGPRHRGRGPGSGAGRPRPGPRHRRRRRQGRDRHARRRLQAPAARGDPARRRGGRHRRLEPREPARAPRPSASPSACTAA